MLEASVSPRLPGISASGTAKVMAIVSGVIVLIGSVLLALGLVTLTIVVPTSQSPGIHLPWPALQWALTTPLGVLLLAALCLLVTSPSYLLLNLWQLRSQIARAIDITGFPPAWWYGLWPTYPQQSSRQRWLGESRREQALSLALLMLGILLVLAFMGLFVVSGVYMGRATQASCGSGGNGCAPMYPLPAIVFAGWFPALLLPGVARFLWLRHAESTGRVWFRYRSWFNAQLYYVRQPGATPEAAAAALARFASPRPIPWVRTVFFDVLALTPYALLVSASFVLSGWLQLQSR